MVQERRMCLVVNEVMIVRYERNASAGRNPAFRTCTCLIHTEKIL
jgi:hypothetical protein